MKLASGLAAHTVTAKRAIVLYEPKNGGSSFSTAAFAMLHPIEMQGDRPVIKAGELMDVADLQGLLTEVLPARRLRFVDERMLAWGDVGMVWWVPASRRRIWFRTDGEDGLGTVNGMVWHPNLIFTAGREGWRVFAVKEDGRPTERTKLWRAPYYNVSKEGHICEGTATIPEDAVPEETGRYEDAFFGSNFTHANANAKADLTKFKGGLSALWKERLRLSGRKFPKSTLVESGATLGQLIQRMA
ncbi:MAG: PRTRC system protein B [Nevskiaceae bacterium]|nr:MAG: PRTRC system protein B [Nevskiaceae bacterium]